MDKSIIGYMCKTGNGCGLDSLGWKESKFKGFNIPDYPDAREHAVGNFSQKVCITIKEIKN